uniref:UDP-glucuronate decarboxylase n=1 Tax=Cucumis sativus TaxID=3659 RepID=A0A0A0KCJ0_CUCSA
MLGLAKRVGARFLLTSTSEVYGDPLQHPQAETYWGNVNPIGVRSCYDEGKRTAETLTMDYHRGLGIENLESAIFLQVRIARIFNTYGPRMCIDDGRVVSNFVAQVRFSLFMVLIWADTKEYMACGPNWIFLLEKYHL